MTAAHVLRQAGLLTLEAETADAAADLLRAQASELSAVFSDIETPGRLDGLTLARLVSEAWPALPVLLTSGRVTPPSDTLPPGARFVSKPYDIAQVAQLLHDLIEG